MPTPSQPERAVVPVIIDRHHVAPGGRVLVMAEAGVNHNGCVDTAMRMVDAAADAGADAVKFQLFRAGDLVTASAPTTAYQETGSGESSQHAMLSRLELSDDEFIKIKDHCEERGVMFLATPFTLNDLARLIDLDAPAIKIASTDLTNRPLLDAAAATLTPIVLSTGASTEVEIRAAVDGLLEVGADDRVVLLHCVSCYPTPLEVVNLRAIRSLERRFSLPCGLSDHTTSTQVGGWAVAAGACILEKHFTLDPGAPGPDHAMSLDPGQFAAYVAGVRGAERALGDGRLGMSERETEVRTVATKSVVAAVDIPAGSSLASDMLTLKRPGTGIQIQDLHRLVGRQTAVDVPSDTVLSWSMVR